MLWLGEQVETAWKLWWRLKESHRLVTFGNIASKMSYNCYTLLFHNMKKHNWKPFPETLLLTKFGKIWTKHMVHSSQALENELPVLCFSSVQILPMPNVWILATSLPGLFLITHWVGFSFGGVGWRVHGGTLPMVIRIHCMKPLCCCWKACQFRQVRSCCWNGCWIKFLWHRYSFSP